MRRVLITAVALAVALGILAYWYCTGSRVHMPKRPAVSINISLIDQPLTTITNTDGLVAVMKMLRSGRRAKLHECAARGTMDIRFDDGQALTVGFGPAHDSLRYEFGMRGHLFVVPRSRFLDSLKAAGVDVQKIPTE